MQMGSLIRKRTARVARGAAGGCLLGAVFAFCLSGAVALAAPKEPGLPNMTAPELKAPTRLTLAQNDHVLLVTDHAQGMVLTLDARTLEILHWFSIEGQPLGIAATGLGPKMQIFVGNDTSKRVEVYDSEGQLLYQFGGPREYVWQPNDIAIDEEEGLVFVVDGQEAVIDVFSIDGQFLRTIPPTGPAPFELPSPAGVAVDPDRKEVLISDNGDPDFSIKATIKIYSYEGTLLRTITGKLGMLGSRFSRPQGVAVDVLGRVFVVDCVAGQVLMFDGQTGAQLKVLGDFGTEPGQLQFPLDLVVHPSTHDIYVTNNRQGRVEVFPAGGTLP